LNRQPVCRREIQGGLQRVFLPSSVCPGPGVDENHSGLGAGERKAAAIAAFTLHQDLRCDPNSRKPLKLLAGRRHISGLNLSELI